MKGFKRTNKGISNQHLFYDVDFVVYVEGGPKSFSKEDVYKGSFHEETDDVVFWTHVFARFKDATSVKFKSVGSKTTIKEIAVDLVGGRISGVMVAMDNEFDEILENRWQHKDIFYTHGYSWENDVWDHQVVTSVIAELSAVTIENEDIRQNFEQFLGRVRLGVLADGYLFSRGESFFPRQRGHLACVDCEPEDLPEVKADVVKQLINKKGLKASTLYAFGRRKSIDVKKYCYGHLLADYCCQIVIHYLRNRLSLPSINKSIVYRVAIKKFFELFFTDTVIYEHYAQQFSRAVTG